MTNSFSKKQLLLKVVLTCALLVFLIVFFQAWQNVASLIGFMAAYFLGIILLYLDEQYLYKFYIEKTGDSIENTSHFSVLASRNLLFLLLLPLLSIFVLTSSGSLLGIALILSINLYLLIEMWQLRSEPLLFKERFLSVFKGQVNQSITNRFCLVSSIYFIFLLAILFL
jgi:hypothetical protein